MLLSAGYHESGGPFMPKPGFVAAALAAVVLSASPASADITAFLGLSPTPATRQARGLALGAGILALGLEFEYADLSEDFDELAPGLRVGSFNALLQTPVPIAGIRFYVTAGAGVYRERLAEFSETNLALNLGGGAKVGLAGPLRLRLDYRVLNLRGSPRHDRYHRVYAGLNLGF
jgi:hypothetical protein